MKKNYFLLAIMAFMCFKAFSQPIVAASTPPTRATTDVVSLFGDAYTNVSAINWFPNWGQTTVVSDLTVAGVSTKYYAGLNYQGVQLTGTIDVSTMTTLHVDIWSSNCTSILFKLINTSPATVEQGATITLTPSSWNSIDIPLSQYNNIALNNVAQLMFVGVTPATGGNFYMENCYFWKSSNVPTITGFSMPTKVVGDAPFTITPPTSNSTGAFTYTSSDPTVATITGNTVTVVGGGTSLITANQAAAGTYVAGSASATLTVNFATLNTAAPVPTHPSSNVISLYSDSYTNVPGTDWFPGWGQSTKASDTLIAGDTTRLYQNMNYQGVQFASAIDASSMNYLHVDLYTPNATAFDVYLINTSPSTVEQKYTLHPTLNGWNGFDIPLSAYTSIALNNLGQIKLVDTPFGKGVVYMDNLYFWKLGSVTITPAPVPTQTQSNVISLFSDTYNNVAGTDWFPNWGQTTVVADTLIAGDTTKMYTTMNYQGVSFATPLNVSSMQNLHIDIWTANSSAFDLNLINTSPATVQQKVTLHLALQGWNSFDIPLSKYSNISLSSINQMLFVDTPFGTGKIYVDNVYFWKSANAPTITNFNIPAQLVGAGPYTITAPTSNSSGTFTYTSSDPTVATINGNIITILSAGSAIITATQAAAGTYGAGTISSTLVVTFAPPLTHAPVPTHPAANVISLYSNTYTNVAGTDWFPGWGQSTAASDIVIAGDTTRLYQTMNYQGVQFAAPIDASKMNFFHIDIWTPNATAFDVYLINIPPATQMEQKYTLKPTLNGWNSFDIPLTAYNTIALNTIGQFKFVDTPFGKGTVYVDNMYFWKTSGVPVTITGFTAALKENKTIINWNTVTDDNALVGFNVERSQNGKDWSTISFVAAKTENSATKQYALTDKPLNGANYYRLKTINKDGKDVYSDIRLVMFDRNAVKDITFYPNPAKDKVVVSLNKIDTKTATLNLIGMDGKVLKTIMVTDQNSFGNVTMDVSNLSKGMYLLQLTDGNYNTTQKVIIN